MASQVSPEIQSNSVALLTFSGEISLNNLQMRYREGLPLVLKGVSLDISPGQRVGIVGRTGSGKSSLTLSIFRLVLQ